MYKSDCFTEEQMTKYEILSDANKVWDKTLAHFTDLPPSARPVATARQQTADLRVRHMPVTTHPPTALPLPTPRVTSRSTSTLRTWRNHSWWLGTTALQTQPPAHPYHRFSIPSGFYKPNLRATQAGIGSHGTE